MITERNLCKVLRKSFNSIGDRNCVIFLPKGDPIKSVSLSGVEIHEKAIEMAYRIQKRTDFLINKKCPILLAMSPGLDFVVTFVACLYAGVTVAPIPISKNKLQQERIQNIVNDCSASEVLCDESGYEALKELFIDSSFKVHRITDNHKDEDYSQYELIGFSSTSEDSAYIQYTSGSFKKPKGILLSHGNVIHNLGLAGSTWGFNEKTVAGSWLPHYHDMGLGTILISLLYGSTIVFMSPLAFIQKPIRWFKMISDYKVTLSGAPPFAYDLCNKRIGLEELNGLNLSSWEHAFASSEVVYKKTIQSFKNKFSSAGLRPGSLFACYGMAEANLFVAGEKQVKKNESPLLLEGLIEPCLLNAEIKKTIIIVDFVTQQPLLNGEKGEIWIQSPSLAKGYITPATENGLQISSTEFEKTCEGIEGNWFSTGDVGYINGNSLYVLGRQKDTFKINGLNVSASDVEWYASNVHPNLNPAGAAAFRINDNEVCLLIETFTSEPINIEEVKAQIKSKIISYFSLELSHILILKRGALDRTSSGKIRRYTIGQSFNLDIYRSKIIE